MVTLEQALVLRPTGEGAWSVRGDPGYEASTGMFGGWTAAALLKAVLTDARAQGTPIALTVHYVSRVDPRRDLTIGTTSLGSGRSLATWRSDISADGQGDILATATIVMANRRESTAFTEPTPPHAAEPSTLPLFHPPAPFGEKIDIRPMDAHAPFNRPDTRTLNWVRETSGRGMDQVQLAYLADCYAPRIFMKSDGPRPSSTVTMSVYFYATPEEMAAVGDDYILSEVVGTRAESSSVGSQMRLWSRQGVLLATSEQTCWFR